MKRNWNRLAAAIGRFAATKDGATAVEFALIAPAFLGTLIAVLEVAVFLFAQQVLQTAATTAGRLIMTGQAQKTAMTQDQFTSAICPSISAIFTCSRLMVDVQSYSSFIGASAAPPSLTFNSSGNVANNWSYNPGVQGSVVIVRLMYQEPIVTGPLGFAISHLANGATLMMGVTRVSRRTLLIRAT